jgi:hypothetical protein
MRENNTSNLNKHLSQSFSPEIFFRFFNIELMILLNIIKVLIVVLLLLNHIVLMLFQLLNVFLGVCLVYFLFSIKNIFVGYCQDLSNSYGYSVRFESVLPRPYGSLLFCTIGVLLRKLESDLTGISYVIVGEICKYFILERK